MLDYVFSDKGQVLWDNNNQRDFHTRVEGAWGWQGVSLSGGAALTDCLRAG